MYKFLFSCTKMGSGNKLLIFMLSIKTTFPHLFQVKYFQICVVIIVLYHPTNTMASGKNALQLLLYIHLQHKNQMKI